MKYRILNNIEEAKNAIMIREKVFMQEQGFEDEFDDIDHQALHLELFNEDIPVACARMFTFDNKVYILGRVAVLKEYRGLHYGSKLIEILEKEAKERKAQRIELSAQSRVSVFYEKLGYTRIGEEYMDEHCPHIKMIKEFIYE